MNGSPELVDRQFMAIQVTTSAANVAGSLHAAQVAAKESPRREAPSPSVRRREDQLLLSAEGVESIEAIRRAGGNGEEETREDRQEHPDLSEPHGRLDLNG